MIKRKLFVCAATTTVVAALITAMPAVASNTTAPRFALPSDFANSTLPIPSTPGHPTPWAFICDSFGRCYRVPV